MVERKNKKTDIPSSSPLLLPYRRSNENKKYSSSIQLIQNSKNTYIDQSEGVADNEHRSRLTLRLRAGPSAASLRMSVKDLHNRPCSVVPFWAICPMSRQSTVLYGASHPCIIRDNALAFLVDQKVHFETSDIPHLGKVKTHHLDYN